ncbi:hypothetical protein NL676_018205 [Syzygium grande]|nr:hypothetical protein NL676_018205 [Syzygium grande]
MEETDTSIHHPKLGARILEVKRPANHSLCTSCFIVCSRRNFSERESEFDRWWRLRTSLGPSCSWAGGGNGEGHRSSKASGRRWCKVTDLACRRQRNSLMGGDSSWATANLARRRHHWRWHQALSKASLAWASGARVEAKAEARASLVGDGIGIGARRQTSLAGGSEPRSWEAMDVACGQR